MVKGRLIKDDAGVSAITGGSQGVLMGTADEIVIDGPKTKVSGLYTTSLAPIHILTPFLFANPSNPEVYCSSNNYLYVLPHFSYLMYRLSLRKT